jgi:uncharacterized RDD family membrane protein YckC
MDHGVHYADDPFAPGGGEATTASSQQDAERWRQEVASRVQQHRARRRRRQEPEGAMSLDLEFLPEPEDTAEESAHREPPPLIVPRPEEVMPVSGLTESSILLEGASQDADPPLPPFDDDLAQHDAGKIIRFPRTFAREAKRIQLENAKRGLSGAKRENTQEPLRAFFQELSRASAQQPEQNSTLQPSQTLREHSSHETPLPDPQQTLAQKPPMVMVEVEMPDPMQDWPVEEAPVSQSLPVLPMQEPRIVYAAEIPPPAEQMELLPSFDDIRLESPVETPRVELEMPLQVAPLNMRAMSGIVDVGIVLGVTAALAFGFMQVAPSELSARMAAPCLLATCGVLWVVFQYLFLVHGRGTPGMKFADLELVTFTGKPASDSSRRIRALACAVSAFSVGLGYVWTLVDEDMLGWHDRMSATCLKQSTASLLHSASVQSYSEDIDDVDLPY